MNNIAIRGIEDVSELELRRAAEGLFQLLNKSPQEPSILRDEMPPTAVNEELNSFLSFLDRQRDSVTEIPLEEQLPPPAPLPQPPPRKTKTPQPRRMKPEEAEAFVDRLYRRDRLIKEKVYQERLRQDEEASASLPFAPSIGKHSKELSQRKFKAPFHERTKSDIDKRKAKLEALKVRLDMQKAAKELPQLTFHPNVKATAVQQQSDVVERLTQWKERIEEKRNKQRFDRLAEAAAATAKQALPRKSPLRRSPQRVNQPLDSDIERTLEENHRRTKAAILANLKPRGPDVVPPPALKEVPISEDIELLLERLDF
eukprot:TRINITY_DN5347_c0_g1_i2.p1 TRINITY_DN5347_c0_g1~~TRINITY_DN5347_c0_g1_i2.p1  ORF type:complete len:314 (-),score=87.49 TRINITY_DN5347_c0_g1_i2:130-1071(-)